MRKKFKNIQTSGKAVAGVKSRDAKSVAMLLREHSQEGYIPFHMPGHKRSKDYSFLSNLQEMDITEIEGFDNLHNCNGVLADAQRRAADLYGVRESRYLTCGSTAGVLAAIRAMTSSGDGILVARNCHRSVYNAVELCGLRPYYVAPAYFEEYGFYGSVMPEDIANALDEHPDVTLVVVTSPTYEGVISDIKSIAAICRSHNAKLFVDEAHGAHLGLCKKFEQSARNLGADVVVNSLHKTLPCLTQTAILHICGDSVDVNAIDRNLAVFQTSSPSYVLMASIEGCMRFFECDGLRELDRWSEQVDKFRRSLSRFKRIRLFNGNGEGRVFAYDKTKLVFLTVDSAISGITFMRELRGDHKIELEMASANYALAMTGAGDSLNAYLALSEAVFAIENSVNERYGLVNINNVKIPKKVFEPHETYKLNREFANLDTSTGLVCAENVWAYPPGCPIICKGEKISQDFIRHAMFLYESGVSVESERKQFPDRIYVVAQDFEAEE